MDILSLPARGIFCLGDNDQQEEDRDMSWHTTLPPEQQSIWAHATPRAGTFIGLTAEDIRQALSQRFEHMVRTFPDRLAVQGTRYRYTYNELNRTANRIAHAILERRGEGTEPIVLLFEHDAQIIAAIFGVLKAAKMYVPLDPSHPPARLAYMLADSQAGLIVTDAKNRARAQALAQGTCQVLSIDELDPTLSTENPALPIPLDTYAYLIYTSGSTGQPKGVIGSHGDAMHFTRIFTHNYQIGTHDRLGLLNSCSFSGSLSQIFASLLNGAALCLYDVRQHGVHTLGDWLRRQRITQYNSVPALFRELVATFTGAEEFPDLRIINLGGDRIYKSDVEIYKKYFSDTCIMTTGLGMSEAKIIRWFFIDKTTNLSHNYVPAGYAVDDMDVLLLDDNGNEVATGDVGEIVVRSRYMSPGYWRRPEETRQKFRPAPDGGAERLYYTGDLGRLLPDGCLMHLGRQDLQVKIRGYRIEIADIETTLLNLEAVAAAVVVAHTDRGNEPRLVAYIVPTEETPPGVSQLRRTLSTLLPDYMIPSAFVFLDTLPHTTLHKVDRTALPAPGRLRPALDQPYTAPRTPIEERLCDLWIELLDLETVGIHDPFLELGGHSLLATQLIARVMRTFGVDIPLRTLMEAPTVAEMALVITQHQAIHADQQIMEQMLTELETRSEGQA
jgi:amino acid adenylation domain-containing protein